MDLSPWQHDHVFDQGNPLAEKQTWNVVVITAVMMVVELVAGQLSGSMALFADGLHMGTHVVALGITAGAYLLARRHARDPRYAFGTWKLEILGGFASAIVLGVVAVVMIVEAVSRLISPEPIGFREALIVAVIGLIVNLGSALLLQGHDHSHKDDCERDPHRAGHAHDLNLRAAYVHVLADALTSILAIGALLGGMYLDWVWLDPATGIVGAAVVGIWSIGLIRDTSRILLDREMDHTLVDEIRQTLESDGHTQVVDLHVWRVGRASFSVVVSIVSPQPNSLVEYRAKLGEHSEIAHLTIEIEKIDGGNSQT